MMTHWKKLSVLVSVAALVVAVLALQPASAGNFREQISGNFFDTSLDINEDGMAANYFSGTATGRNSAAYEGLVEIMFTDPSGACATGEVEGDVVTYSIVRRYDNGDLLVSELVDGLLCFDPGTGLASLEVDAAFAGGTGAFANATGSYTARYTVELLLPDPMGGIAHGLFYGETRGSN